MFEVYMYMYDVLVSGETEMEHLTVLEAVLSRLQESRILCHACSCCHHWST